MPRYIYECGECERQFQINHSIKDTLCDCETCGVKGSLYRVPQLTMRPATERVSVQKPGDIVNEYIETTKQEVKEQKETLKQERRNDN